MLNVVSKNVFLFIIALPFLFSCTAGHKPFKTKISSITNLDCKNITDENYYHDSYFTSCNGSDDQKIDFSVIELDDYGEFWNPKQVTTALKSIKDNASSRPTVLVTFIHGWRNNASEKSGNLVDFRNLARSFSELDCGLLFETSEPNCIKPNISAVYISWRGDPLGITQLTSNKLLKSPQYLSFWNRWRASQKISNTNVTHLLLKLSGMVDEGDRRRLEKLNHRSCIYSDYRADGNQCSKKIIIGHSFGGRILEHAVAQGFIGSRNLANKLDISGFVADSLNKRKVIEANVKEINLSTSILEKQKKDLDTLLASQASTQGNKNASLLKLKLAFENKQQKLKEIKNQGKYQAIVKVFDEYINASFDLAHDLINSYLKNECKLYLKISANNSLSKNTKLHYQDNLSCDETAQLKTKSEDEKDELKKTTQRSLVKNSCSTIKNLHNTLVRNSFILNNNKLPNLKDCKKENIDILNQVLEQNNKYKIDLISMLGISNYVNLEEYISHVELSLNSVLKDIDTYNESIPWKFRHSKFNTTASRDNLNALIKKEFVASWPKKTQDGSPSDIEKVKDTINKHIETFNSLSDEILNLSNQIRNQEKSLKTIQHKLEILDKEISFNNIRLEDLHEQGTHLLKDKIQSIEELKILAERFEKLAYSIYQRPYDLAVLLNPANEALSTNMLISAMCDSATYYRTRNQLGINPDPWMLAISSENDEATGVFYKIATRLNTNKRIFQERPVNEVRESPFINGSARCQKNKSTQYDLAHTPAPFIRQLQSHDLELSNKSLSSECKDPFNVSTNTGLDSISYGITQGFKYQNKINNEPNCQKIEKIKLNSATGNSNIDELLLGSFNNDFLKLKRQDTNFDTPDFWAFTVKENIIKDHNDIFNSKVGKLLGTLMKKFKSIGEQCLSSKHNHSPSDTNNNICIFLDDPFLTQKSI